MPRKKEIKKYTLQEIYEYALFNGVDQTVFQAFAPEEIEDEELRKMWIKAGELMTEIGDYLKEKTGNDTLVY